MADGISTLMNKNRNKFVFLRLSNNQTIKGNLVDFDVHMKLTLVDAEYISNDRT